MSRNSRKGDFLWYEWVDGGFEDDAVLWYYTFDHVDVSHPVVTRALASALQRDGVVDTLGQGYKVVEDSDENNFLITYAGKFQGEIEMILCDSEGVTFYGDIVDEKFPVTVVGLDVEAY